MIAMRDDRRAVPTFASDVERALAAAREAQLPWAQRPVGERAKLIGTLRPLIAEQAMELARAAGLTSGRCAAEKMVSEVLPLIEAAKFLQKNAARILQSERFRSAGRPLWLHGSSFVIARKPFGVVLIVGPGNYPLFIPAVQMLHALVAGNAVAIKPAESSSAPLTFLLEQVFRRSAIPSELIQLLPESPESARQAVRLGIDKAIFTGSSENGRDFLGELAKANTPSVMELSGADTVFVRADADVELAAKTIAFGLRLNAGNTCMAPHTIIVHEEAATPFLAALRKLDVETNGVFRVRDDADALAFAGLDEHGLGASIFSRDENAARLFAKQLSTGFVTINDIIVPTADPRFPFGGVRGSGFGVTRGAEGLLGMTHAQVVAVRRTRFLPHLEAAQENDAEFFAAYTSLMHGGGLPVRFRAFRRLLQAGRDRARSKGKTK